MSPVQIRMALLAMEILVVLALRLSWVYRRQKVLPRGSTVERANGKPVMRFPWTWRPSLKREPGKRETTDI